MATAENVNVDVVKTVKEPAVRLTLTKDEASALKSVLGLIAGDPLTTSRKHTQAISRALENAGVKRDSAGTSGVITFHAKPAVSFDPFSIYDYGRSYSRSVGRFW